MVNVEKERKKERLRERTCHYFSFTCSAKEKEREKEQEMWDAEKKKSENKSEHYFQRSMIATPYSNNINFHLHRVASAAWTIFYLHSWIFLPWKMCVVVIVVKPTWSTAICSPFYEHHHVRIIKGRRSAKKDTFHMLSHGNFTLLRRFHAENNKNKTNKILRRLFHAFPFRHHLSHFRRVPLCI